MPGDQSLSVPRSLGTFSSSALCSLAVIERKASVAMLGVSDGVIPDGFLSGPLCDIVTHSQG